MDQDGPMAVGNETACAVRDEPEMVQGVGLGISKRLYNSFLPSLMGSVADRRAVYLAGTCRSVGRG